MKKTISVLLCLILALACVPAAAAAISGVCLRFLPPGPGLIEENALEKPRSPTQGGKHLHVAQQADEPDDQGAGSE